MSKRAAEEFERGGAPLKGGERVEKAGVEDEGLEFEDEFEDEFESEDEILEAGVDGRPDAEREAEEKAGMLIIAPSILPSAKLNFLRGDGGRSTDIHSRAEQT
jgi:hypothetical protein